MVLSFRIFIYLSRKGWIMEEEIKQISEEEVLDKYWWPEYFWEHEKLEKGEWVNPTQAYKDFVIANKKGIELIYSNPRCAETLKYHLYVAFEDAFKKEGLGKGALDDPKLKTFPPIYVNFIKNEILSIGKEYNTFDIEEAKRALFIALNRDPDKYANTEHNLNWLAEKIAFRYKAYHGDEVPPQTLSPEIKVDIANWALSLIPKIAEEEIERRKLTKKERQEIAEALSGVSIPINNTPLTPLANSNLPDTLMSTSKAFNKLLEVFTHGKQGVPINVAGNNKSEVLIRASVYFDEEYGINYLGSKTPTFFDLIVANALGSIFRQSGANKAITPDQVYRELAGVIGSGYKVNEKQSADVEISIERLRTMRGFIDYTEQARKHTKHGIKPDTAIIEDFLLSASRVFSASGGHIVSSYLLKDTPLFFRYSQDIKQITQINKTLLNHEYTGDGGKRETLNRSELTLVINWWLLNQIEMMKSLQKRGLIYEQTRTYETFFERTQTAKPVQNMAIVRLRKHFKFFLEKFKRESYIANYEEARTGRKITGFKILLPPLPPKQLKS